MVGPISNPPELPSEHTHLTNERSHSCTDYKSTISTAVGSPRVVSPIVRSKQRLAEWTARNIPDPTSKTP